MNLQVEHGSFKNDSTGEIIEYTKYYVDFNGVKIYLKPADNTAKQILEMLLAPKK